MTRAKLATLSLMVAIVVWGTVLGGFLYSHLVFFPAFLADLPDSTVVALGPYPVEDARFWMVAHLGLFAALPLTLALHWKFRERRKLILWSIAGYLVALVATFVYFVPELLAFARSPDMDVEKAEWLARSSRWFTLSWLRGTLMYVSFVPLMVALARPVDGVASRD